MFNQHFAKALSLIFLSFFVFAPVIAGEDSRAQVRHVFNEVLASREKLKSAHIIIEYQDQTNQRDCTYTHEILYDPPRILNYRTQEDRKLKFSSDLVSCFDCVEPGAYLDFSNRLLGVSDKERLAISINPTNEVLKLASSFNGDYIPDPRYIALTPMTIFSVVPNQFHHSPHLYFFPQKETDDLMEYTMSQEEYCGVTCTKVERTLSYDHGYEKTLIWISESQGHSIRKYVIEVNDSMLVRTKTLEVDVAFHEKSGLWYPSAWKLDVKQENSKSWHLEKGTIKVISLNEPIDASLFEMKNLRYLKKGSPVRWNLVTPPPFPGDLFWDGTKIVSGSDYHESELNLAQDTKRRWVIVLVNVALVSALIATILYRKYRKMAF